LDISRCQATFRIHRMQRCIESNKIVQSKLTWQAQVVWTKLLNILDYIIALVWILAACRILAGWPLRNPVTAPRSSRYQSKNRPIFFARSRSSLVLKPRRLYITSLVSRLNWNGNGQRRWVYFWTDICWTSGLWRDSGAAILQVSCKLQVSKPKLLYSLEYLTALSKPPAPVKSIWTAQFYSTLCTVAFYVFWMLLGNEKYPTLIGIYLVMRKFAR